MIEYLEVRDKDSREVIGIIDNFKSIIWHPKYYGVGDFEIYAVATEKHLDLLQEGNYVTRPDDIEVGIIESFNVEHSAQDGTMIVAAGRYAKSILDRRHIYKLSGKVNTPTILRGNVETAIRSVVKDNAIDCSFDTQRNISFLELGALSNIPAIIVDGNGIATQKQVSYDNLLTYTDGVLQEYGLGSTITLDDSTYNLQYSVYQGADRSVDNTDYNEAIVFSPEYDNLTESNYRHDISTKKTSALIGGEGEGLDRFYSIIKGNEDGIERRETWIDASSINRKYKDEQDVEHTYTDSEYKKMLDALGKQKLAELIATTEFAASINVTGGKWRLNEDYWLGDIVTIQDNEIGVYVNARITEYIETQDENGYTIEPTFEYFEPMDIPEPIFLLTESSQPILTESGNGIMPEESPVMLTSSNSVSGVKISELPESTDVYDGCCMPIVTEGETKKLTYALLKERLGEDLASIMLDLAHPIGSLYYSAESTEPSELFGGTWEQIKDTFILAAGDTYAAGSTGGEATHTLAENEMPNHGQHLYERPIGQGSATGRYLPSGALSSYGSTGRGWYSPANGEYYPAGTKLGGGAAHNNMPPYETYYCWKRTA